jgi:hypothetical protein
LRWRGRNWRSWSEEKAARAKTHATEEANKGEPKVSVSDPEARLMRLADGAVAPAWNVQVATAEGFVVAINVIGTCETTGFCWIARPAVPRQRRVRAKRAREGRHATYNLGRNNLVRRNALLNPSHERAQEIDGVRPGAAVAVRHPGLEEQPGEFLRAMQTFLSLSLIVRALAV